MKSRRVVISPGEGCEGIGDKDVIFPTRPQLRKDNSFSLRCTWLCVLSLYLAAYYVVRDFLTTC